MDRHGAEDESGEDDESEDAKENSEGDDDEDQESRKEQRSWRSDSGIDEAASVIQAVGRGHITRKRFRK